MKIQLKSDDYTKDLLKRFLTISHLKLMLNCVILSTKIKQDTDIIEVKIVNDMIKFIINDNEYVDTVIGVYHFNDTRLVVYDADLMAHTHFIENKMIDPNFKIK